jgi:hypothetical protein
MLSRCVTMFGSVDWGFTNPACLLVGGVDGDGRWFLVDVWYRRGQTREQVGFKAKQLNKQYNIRKWWSDHDPEGIKHMREVTEEDRAAGVDRGCDVDLAHKEVEAGVQFTRTLFPVRHDGEPRIYVAAELEDWRREVDGYYFPEDAEEPEGQFGDHAMDATRYLTYSHSQAWASKAAAMGVVLPTDLTKANPYAGM